MPKVKIVDLVKHFETNQPCWAMIASKGDCDYFFNEVTLSKKKQAAPYPFENADRDRLSKAAWADWTWSSPENAKAQTVEHARYYGGPRWAVIFEEMKNELGEIHP